MSKPKINQPKQPKKKSNSKSVGYKSPPVDHQWKKGQSGNPAGKPKGSHSVRALIYQAGLEAIDININGTVERKTILEASIKKMWEQCIKGNIRAFEMLAAHYEEGKKEIELTPEKVQERQVANARILAKALLTDLDFDALLEEWDYELVESALDRVENDRKFLAEYRTGLGEKLRPRN